MKQINRSARNFYKALNGSITEATVQNYINSKGYDIVCFGEEDTALFDMLEIAPSYQSCPSFTFVGKGRRIVFIHASVGVLSHLLKEVAHIELGHPAVGYLLGNTPKMCKEALLFTSLLLCGDINKKRMNTKSVFCIASGIILTLLILISSVLIASQKSHGVQSTPLPSVTTEPQISETVYVTKSGCKFHRASCRYATTGFEISRADALLLGYTPCSICSAQSTNLNGK